MQRVFHRDALALVGELLGVADAVSSRLRAPVPVARRSTRRAVGRVVELANAAMAIV